MGDSETPEKRLQQEIEPDSGQPQRPTGLGKEHLAYIQPSFPQEKERIYCRHKGRGCDF
jgi:hypothetical protein